MKRTLSQRISSRISTIVKSLHDCLIGGEKILVLGDSHAHVFEHYIFSLWMWRYRFKVAAVGGATISGLTNPSSKTQAMAIFRRELESNYAGCVILQLGEVDLGYVIWFKAQSDESNDKQMAVLRYYNIAIQRYINFIDEVAMKSAVVVVSAPLPTIGDDVLLKGEVAKQRVSVSATQFERTELTLRFNQEIEAYCFKRGYVFISLDQDSMGSDGLVSRHMLNKSQYDHHYSTGVYARLLADKLLKAKAKVKI